MIASVVATIDKSGGMHQDIIDAIAGIPNVEVGAVDGNARRIPITIDSPGADTVEETTRRIQACPGVAFVDVVFVHFEDRCANNTSTSEGTTTEFCNTN